jgi:centrosomal protein CEP112
MFDRQMTKIENDLQRSKMLREKQSKDFQKQLDEVQTENVKTLEHFQNDHENEKLKMKRQFEVERQALKKETLDACAELQQQLQAQLIENNEQHKIKVEKLVSVSGDSSAALRLIASQIVLLTKLAFKDPG